MSVYSDIWALGCVLVEIRSGGQLFGDWIGTKDDVRAHAIARRTPKRTRDYPSPKPTLHRFFSHKPPFFFFNYHTIMEESDSDSEISHILSLDVLKDHKPNKN
jgi:serine/threonine protein kinase